jgi:hypothetical protein
VSRFKTGPDGRADAGAALGARAPAQASEAEVLFALPGEGEPVGFEQHIKPLFRDRDRMSMRFAFDLWSYDEVAEHADALAQRLAAGSMPCDGAWPAERVDVFRRWVQRGMPTSVAGGERPLR